MVDQTASGVVLGAVGKSTPFLCNNGALLSNYQGKMALCHGGESGNHKGVMDEQTNRDVSGRRGCGPRQI